MKNKSKNEYLLYALLFLAVLVLAWAAFSAFSKPAFATDSQGRVLQTSANAQFFQQQAAQGGSECGDLQSEANVQHLSHHPGVYADCLNQVDPSFLQQATGKTLQQILGG